jgi:hypothetical protein
MDFGWTHPFAAVELVLDRDTHTVYLARTHRMSEATPVVHAAAIRCWGKKLPWAWPRHGRRDTLMLRYAECPKDQVTINWERLVTGAYVRERDGWMN